MRHDAEGRVVEVGGVLRAWHQAAGLDLNAHTATADWLGEPLDVGYAIDVLHPLAR